MAERAKFGNIVAAYDGSKDSAKAIKIACSLAAKYRSRLTVVHVYSSPLVLFTAGTGMPMPDYKVMDDAAKEAGMRTLARGVELASAEGAKAKGELLEAQSKVEAIVGFASNEKADLIVVGTRGMTGFKKLLLGSVSSGLVSNAPCPVLVVR